ncbi:MAG TPA: hypothetical protein VHC69_13875 [Polyangiaceae bacterium]|nr:hypothetical protein [Polyangiaceae bacterium]
MGGEQRRYAFEAESEGVGGRPPSRRTRHDAEQALAVLRSRLGVPADAKLEHDLSRALLRFCTDVVLNIAWYERARRREESRNRWMTSGMVALMVVALGLLFFTSLLPSLPVGVPAPSGMLQLTVFAGGALTVLQVIAALADGKARLAIFWKASADLKELLYGFEQRWCDKAVVATGAAPGFSDAIEEAMRSAHAITRAERLDFFATVRSPSDVVAIATSAADTLRGRAVSSTVAAVQHEEAIAEARRELAAARAAVAASEFRMNALPEGAARDGEKIVLINAQSEVVRAERLLHDLTAV